MLLRTLGQIGFLLGTGMLLWGQRPPQPGPPGPPKPPGSALSDHLAEVRRKLKYTNAVNLTAERALKYSRGYLDSAERALRSGQSFAAGRLAEAADALLHIAEHQQHLRTGGGPKGPPPTKEMKDHLERVYFRTQQADYFLNQSHDPQAASFPKWARDFYQVALRAYERSDMVAADENAKCAEEVVRALENLAQAAAPTLNPPPPPPPVPPRRLP
jgi:hypothetical protein